MDKEELKRFETFKSCFDNTLNFCDPIEFARRQQHLLYEMAEFILQPYYDHIKEEKKKS